MNLIQRNTFKVENMASFLPASCTKITTLSITIHVMSQHGIGTLSIMALGIVTITITTLGIMTM